VRVWRNKRTCCPTYFFWRFIHWRDFVWV